MKKDSKEILLEKAKSLFAKQGFSATSTREIAAAAKINISAIAYYFKGKKGLYQAILQELVDDVQNVLKDKLIYAEKILAEPKNNEQAENCLCDLINTFGSLIFSKDFSNDGVTIFLNEYTTPGESFKILYDGLIFPIHKIFTDLIIRASCAENNSAKKEMLTLYTFPLFSSLFVFKTRKKSIISHMNWEDYSNQEIQKMLDVIITQVKSIINTYKNADERTIK